jgi:nucleoside-diphosphate-sugar epimerase
MHVLITGGAGYLGSVMVPRLLAAGHHVTVLDNFMYGQASLLDCCHDPKLEIIRGHALDRPLLTRLLAPADVIFPLACLTGAPACDRDPVGARAVAVDAVRLLLELRSPRQLVVFPNTNSGYGIGEEGRECTEESALRPVSLYGRLKVEAEAAVLDAPHTIALRLATVFGPSPRMRLDLLVNDFTYRAVTDGFVVLFEAHFQRNYVHVRDVARAFLYCVEHADGMVGTVYNVGLSEANLTKRELCEAIRRHVPRFSVVEAEVGRDPDQRNYVVSNARIEKAGFRAEIGLETGIRELLKAYAVVRRQGYTNA